MYFRKENKIDDYGKEFLFFGWLGKVLHHFVQGFKTATI